MISGLDIICISSIEWDFLWQGHQEITSRLAEAGNRVLYIENTGVRSPGIRDARRIRTRIKNWIRSLRSHGLREVAPNIFVCSPLVLPPFGAGWQRAINRRLLLPLIVRSARTLGMKNILLWSYLPTDTALDLVRMLRGPKTCLVYYCVDNFALLTPKVHALRENERATLRLSDVVFTTCSELAANCTPWNNNVHIFPFGVNLEAFPFECDARSELVALKGRTSIRFDSYLTEDAGVESALKQSSFVRPYFKINTGYSLMVDLLQPIAARRSQARPRHRSYIKKALDKNIEWKAGRDGPLAQELVSLHGEMMTQKKLSLSRIGIYEVSSLCDILEEQAVIFTGYLEGQAITSTLVLSFGRKAFYLIGASGKQGRALRASYGLLDQLLGYLKAEGMAQFDFGGLDPLGLKAAGVDQFKTGFGGEMVKHLGEWEWATDGWLRWGFNVAVRSRGRKL